MSRPPVVSATEGMEVLNRAGEVLTGSLALEETLSTVAGLIVPRLADWAAILMVAEDGSEREFSSRHPDAEVEAAIMAIRRRRRDTGGSESIQVQQTGKPILATDASAPPDDVSRDEQSALDRLAARSYMLVPLRARGRLFGSMTLLSTTPGRHYTEEDLAFAMSLSGRCALAIDNARLYESASRSLGLLDTLFSTAPVGLAFVDGEGRFVRVNDALAAISGRSIDEHLGHPVHELLNGAGREIDAVLADGVPRLEVETTVPGPGGRGTRHWVSSYTPVRGLEGELLGVGLTVIDITERRRMLERERALLAAEQAARVRADFLARAGKLLDASLDYEETLRTLARIAVPEIADWCAITMVDSDGALKNVITAHSDPAKQALAEEYERRHPPDPNSPGGTHGVVRSGVAQVVREVTDQMLVDAIRDPEQLARARALDLRSVVIAPLVAHQRTLGTLSLATAETGRTLGDADVQLAVELGRRAGVAIDNARLYTERSQIAHTLQSKLLPERLPEIPGARVAARYRAAGELNEVGGDFYDVFERAEREWALVVGDVSGKGAGGAAVTALARYTLRAVCPEGGPPSAALLRLNAATLTSAMSEFITVALAYVAPRDGGGLTVRVALAGHPPPVVRRLDGRVERIGTAGTLVGAFADPRLTDTEVALEPGELMLLFTDGVTEAGPSGGRLGEDGLAALVAELPVDDPDRLVAEVEAAAVRAQPGEPRDDIALLAVLATS
ncbi:MAG TPA: SpoIIE family protein phosphatase [Solirubrobacteraceae bacterium]|jgi:PAS domain S-box-containing protein